MSGLDNETATALVKAYQLNETPQNYNNVQAYFTMFITAYARKRKKKIPDQMWDEDDIAQVGYVTLWKCASFYHQSINNNFVKYFLLCYGRKILDIKKMSYRHERKKNKLNAQSVVYSSIQIV